MRSCRDYEPEFYISGADLNFTARGSTSDASSFPFNLDLLISILHELESKPASDKVRCRIQMYTPLIPDDLSSLKSLKRYSEDSFQPLLPAFTLQSYSQEKYNVNIYSCGASLQLRIKCSTSN
jgi:hypothetical protein